MDGIVDVTIPVAADVAATLADAGKREAIGRIVSRLLRPVPGDDPLLETMKHLSADATAKGLTSEILDAEPGVHKSERRR